MSGYVSIVLIEWNMTDEQKVKRVCRLISTVWRDRISLVKRAFHPNGIVVGYLHGDFMEMSVDDFADFVASQQPSPQESGDGVSFQTLACESEGTTATSKSKRYLFGDNVRRYFIVNQNRR